MRDTSVEAYLMLSRKRGGRKAMIYEFISWNTRLKEYLTDMEMSNELGYPDPNKVRPLRYALMKAGLVEEAGKRECSFTGHTALTWKAKDVDPILGFEGDRAKLRRGVSEGEWNKLNKALTRKGYRRDGSRGWTRRA